MSSNPNSALNALVGGVGGGPLGSLAGQGLSLSSLAKQAAVGNALGPGSIQNIYPHPTSAPPAPPVTRLLRIVMEDGKTYGVIVDGGVNHNDTLPALPLEQAEATVKMMHDIAEQERQEQMRKQEELARREQEKYRKQMEEYNFIAAQQGKLIDEAMRNALEKQKDTERLKREWLVTPKGDEKEQKRSIARRIKDALTQNKTQQEKSK